VTRCVLGVEGLQALVDALTADGYVVIGPTVRDGAVRFGPIRGVADLPHGVADEQSPGRYRLSADGGDLFFGYATAADSLKPYLFPARRTLWRLGEDGRAEPTERDRQRRAFLGVRSCDLHAVGVLRRVLADRDYADADFTARLADTLVVAVTCGSPADTCFCASMGTGPEPADGFDVALTELDGPPGHRFLATSGSEPGAALLSRLPGRAVTDDDDRAADRVREDAVAAIHRSVDTDHIREVLYANVEHPRWDDVANRCLACANCTLVCPTCFCFTTEDVNGLTGPVGRDRAWDSCFTSDHSFLHGGPVRRSTRTRYRQWLTHKFASWIDQFDTSGCVGCGRCITWCPVGIDVTEELAAIRATSARPEDQS
jgi:ferredoxin